jgi:hypothetical protein
MRQWAKRLYSRAGGATATLGATCTCSVTTRHDDETSSQDEDEADCKSKTASRIVAEICFLREGIG